MVRIYHCYQQERADSFYSSGRKVRLHPYSDVDGLTRNRRRVEEYVTLSRQCRSPHGNSLTEADQMTVDDEVYAGRVRDPVELSGSDRTFPPAHGSQSINAGEGPITVH